MIDPWLVASHSAWIAGLSVLLAALSYASWWASVAGIRLRAALARPGVHLATILGIALFCAGMAATGRTWWEVVLWAALAASLLLRIAASRSK